MKSLNEQISEIVKAKQNRAAKYAALVKLGLQDFEARLILGQASAKVASAFNAFKLTFGVELEVVNAPRWRVIEAAQALGLRCESQSYNHNDSRVMYRLVSDGSLCGQDTVECVSPILKGRNGENSLKRMCEALNRIGATVNRSCGLHVHIGAETLTQEHIVRIFRNYAKCEPVIRQFMPRSRHDGEYCHSLIGHNLEGCRDVEDVAYALRVSRYYTVNPLAYRAHKTVEFRQHAGTTNYEKIKNWLQFLRGLIEVSYDRELTDAEVVSIDSLPFIGAGVKRYYKARANQLNNNN